MQLHTQEIGINPLIPLLPFRLDDVIKDNIRFDDVMNENSAEEEGGEEETGRADGHGKEE
jgi:hypothetical protein